VTSAPPPSSAPLPSEPLPDDELRRRAARVRLVLADGDGVLTDGGVYVGERGEEVRRFSTRDDLAFERLRDAGIAIAILNASEAPGVARRAQKLRARALVGIKDKAAYLETALWEAQITRAEVAYIGDDVDDVPVMETIAPEGLVGAPSDAAPEARRAAHHVTGAGGGRGAFREFAEWILRARG
jgi:3-deoxy-D-manno-octulosonate 8-phosphate phosphatase (KDO 8-P phosphatase)